jgi:hypothetical protein
MNLVTIVTVAGALVGIAAGILAIRRFYHPEAKPQIINPTHQSLNGGRYLTVSVNVPRKRRKAFYWIAIQPDDCRANDQWWPQNVPLSLDANGFASLPGVRLGREGPDSTHDIGKTFTVGLFEVIGSAQPVFSVFGTDDRAMRLPAECKLLHSVDVKRVRD